jgi:hypothetical protein
MVLALGSPAAALADSIEHAQAEVANGQAQWELAQQEALTLQQEGQQEAANARMIAILRSEALRQRQLDLVRNAEAMEQIAAALASAIREEGATVQAANEREILLLKAARLTEHFDAELANAYAQGRADSIANAQAQSNFWHGVADFLTGALTEQNIENVKQIAQEQADEIHTPALVEEENAAAMGAEDLFDADLALNAGALDAASALVDVEQEADALLEHAADSLHSVEVHLAEVEELTAETP